MKSLEEYQKKRMADVVRHNLKADWYFNKTYEKIILLIMFVLGIWKFFELIF